MHHYNPWLVYFNPTFWRQKPIIWGYLFLKLWPHSTLVYNQGRLMMACVIEYQSRSFQIWWCWLMFHFLIDCLFHFLFSFLNPKILKVLQHFCWTWFELYTFEKKKFWDFWAFMIKFYQIVIWRIIFWQKSAFTIRTNLPKTLDQLIFSKFY